MSAAIVIKTTKTITADDVKSAVQTLFDAAMKSSDSANFQAEKDTLDLFVDHTMKPKATRAKRAPKDTPLLNGQDPSTAPAEEAPAPAGSGGKKKK